MFKDRVEDAIRNGFPSGGGCEWPGGALDIVLNVESTGTMECGKEWRIWLGATYITHSVA